MAITACNESLGLSAPHAAPESAQDTQGDKQAYGQILKSSAMIGGSSLLCIAAGVVRTKVMAILLGPAGFGLMSLYSAILELAQNIASMGITGSGVRQMSEALGSGEMARVATTATVLRRISIVLGLLGAGAMFLFAGQLSALTFADETRASAIALLSLAVFFGCIAGGQGALIQGLRRISDLAKMNLLGSYLGAAIAIAMVYVLGERGLVPSLVGISAIAALTAWWYGKRVPLPRAAMDFSQMGREASALLKLGTAFMASALMMAGTAYVVRLILARLEGAEAAGLYQSAWTLGGLYLTFILQAMGADYFPRLSGVAADPVACNRLVNQQAQVSLLLAGPGVLATLTFSPLIIALFYTPKFAEAVGILRWICLGMTLRIVIWPISSVIPAKGAKAFFIGTEVAWTIAHIGLAWVGVVQFGAAGAGMAFFGSYVIYGLLIYPIVRRLTGFLWSSANRRTYLLFLSTIAIVFCCLNIFSLWLGTVIGTSATVLCGLYSIRVLAGLVSMEGVLQPMRRLLALFRLRIRKPNKWMKEGRQ